MRRAPYMRALLFLLAPLAVGACGGCQSLKGTLVEVFTPTYRIEGAASGFEPRFEGRDRTRRRLPIRLVEVARGFEQITDLKFVPGRPNLLVVLEKPGRAKWVDLKSHERGTLLEVRVRQASEEGLLGLAWHPGFTENGRFYLNYVTRRDGRDVTEIWEYRLPPQADLRTTRPRPVRRLLQVAQPYPNHNAGQLAFGPDGLLYVGLGDGGYRDDPHGHGQNTKTLLGAMLRIDVDRQEGGRPYGIPPDNPFADGRGGRPEIYAYGLRNPWRYGFDPKGRLVVADVGQDTYEEVTILGRGENAGWNVREGAHCFPPPDAVCEKGDLVDPVYEYSHEEGQSITGGQVALGSRAPSLRGKYVFGDFVKGRLWAIDLPDPRRLLPPEAALSLGTWPILPSTFGRDAAGDLYVADFASGRIFLITE